MLVRHPRLAKELTVKIIFVIDNKTAQMLTILVVVHSQDMGLVIFIYCNIFHNIHRRKGQQNIKKFTH